MIKTNLFNIRINSFFAEHKTYVSKQKNVLRECVLSKDKMCVAEKLKQENRG